MVKTFAFPVFPRGLVNQPYGWGFASCFQIFLILLVGFSAFCFILGLPPFCSTVPLIYLKLQDSEAICLSWLPPVVCYCIFCGYLILPAEVLNFRSFSTVANPDILGVSGGTISSHFLLSYGSNFDLNACPPTPTLLPLSFVGDHTIAVKTKQNFSTVWTGWVLYLLPYAVIYFFHSKYIMLLDVGKNPMF